MSDGRQEQCYGTDPGSLFEYLNNDNLTDLNADSEIGRSLENLKLGTINTEENQPKVQSVSAQTENSDAQQYTDGSTKLQNLIFNNFIKEALYMISTKPNRTVLDIQNSSGFTALHLAVREQQPTVVRSLVLAGANPNIGTRYKNTALHFACNRQDIECVRALMVSKKYKNILNLIPMDLELLNDDGVTSLHVAAARNNVTILQHLLNYGANVEARNSRNGDSALHLAVRFDSFHVIQFLGRYYPSSLSAVNKDGETPMQLAISLNKMEAMKKLELCSRSCN